VVKVEYPSTYIQYFKHRGLHSVKHKIRTDIKLAVGWKENIRNERQKGRESERKCEKKMKKGNT
jgi:hypothetical protein